jgi:hypothetical protein
MGLAGHVRDPLQYVEGLSSERASVSSTEQMYVQYVGLVHNLCRVFSACILLNNVDSWTTVFVTKLRRNSRPTIILA